MTHKSSFLSDYNNKILADHLEPRGVSQVQTYFSEAPNTLFNKTRKELCDQLHMLARYLVFLRNEYGEAKAKIVAIEYQFKSVLLQKASEYDATTLDERKALAVDHDNSLRRDQRSLIEQQMKKEKVEAIIWGIDSLCQRIETIIKYGY